MYYVYLLKSAQYNWVYIGYTHDLRRRLKEHYAGENLSTKRYLPVKLVYYEAYISKSDAQNREKMLKRYGSSLQKLKTRVKKSLAHTAMKEGLGV